MPITASPDLPPPQLKFLHAGSRTSKSVAKALPVKQQRYGETQKKLLTAGLALLRSGSFDDISIAQISSHAGCSVGSFYLRFHNKAAYFEFLVEGLGEVLRNEAREMLTLNCVRALSLKQTVGFCIDHYIEINRQNEGLIRAALLYSMNGSDDWQPIRDIGLMLHAHYIDLIMSKLRRTDQTAAREQLLIGLQIMSSHLVNSIAHPVIALPLHHPDLSHWLQGVVMHSLNASPPRGAPSATAANDTTQKPTLKAPAGRRH